MNERIRQLALQANIHFSRVGILDGDPNGMAKFVSYSKMEKFAELIVQECMTLMNNERDYYSKPGSYEPESYYIRCAAKEDAFDEAAILIKHHFGVEE